MRHHVKRALCLLVSLSILLTITAIFTLSTTAVMGSQEPMIAIGNQFMLVQTASGELWGWGDNSIGVLGDTPKDTVTSPVKIVLPAGVASLSISAGFDHVLMLGSDGNVYAWGDNTEGQLGISNNHEMLRSPTLVEGLMGKNIISVSAGNRFSLALSDNGRVYSFGRNTLRQLGYDLTEASEKFSITPTRIDALSNVCITKISAGTNSAIAIDQNGKVYLWGSTQNCVLGVANSPASTLPFAMPDSKTTTPIVTSAISQTHSAYLLSDGTVGFMGLNHLGQYGNGETNSDKSIRFRITDTASLCVTTVATSNGQTVLLTADGRVLTAGARISNKEDSASNVFVPLFEENDSAPVAITIAAKYQNGALIAADGSVWAWGDNSCGQLGNGTVGDGQKTPVKVFTLESFTPDAEQLPSTLGVPIRVTTSVPAPTFSIVIPATVDVGDLRPTDVDDPNRNSFTKFTLEATNVSNLFGEKEIRVSVNAADPNGIFYLEDNSGAILPFDLVVAPNAQGVIASGDILAKFTANGQIDAYIRIDQSKITEYGVYNGILVFSYTVADIDR